MKSIHTQSYDNGDSDKPKPLRTVAPDDESLSSQTVVPVLNARTSEFTQASASSHAERTPNERACTGKGRLRAQHPIVDYSPPPARSSPEEHAKLAAEYNTKIQARAAAGARTVPPALSERPPCFGFGPLANDNVCVDCDWKAVCETPPQFQSSVERSRRRTAQGHFAKFFKGAHKVIYGTPAPNLYAIHHIANRVQVICLRERIEPELFLLLKLINSYETESLEKFRLEFLLASWSGFAEMRRVLVQKHGNFDVQTICDFLARHDLIERILPLLPVALGGTSANEPATTTLDQRAEHLFDRSVAKALGGDAAAAVLYKNLRYWCDFYRSQQSKYNFHLGVYWRYDSLDALHERFPYLSRSTINRKLKKFDEQLRIC